MSSWTAGRSRAWTTCRTWSAARAAGLQVRLAVTGQPRMLPPIVELAAYRMVQESLTNALRYARSASASVALGYHDDGLDLVVENAAPPAAGREAGERSAGGGARGLQGLAERAQLLGGSLQAGPRPGGGFSVHAWLPVRQ
jgi:signal transduction histidine kinase